MKVIVCSTSSMPNLIEHMDIIHTCMLQQHGEHTHIKHAYMVYTRVYVLRTYTHTYGEQYPSISLSHVGACNSMHACPVLVEIDCHNLRQSRWSRTLNFVKEKRRTTACQSAQRLEFRRYERQKSYDTPQP